MRPLANRPPSSTRCKIAAVFAALASAAVAAHAFAHLGASSFERRYPGFVEQNLALLQRLRAKPRSRQRDEALANVRANLRWAKAYQRFGFDPDVFKAARAEESAGTTND